jgi:hypothetical protein
MQQAFSAGQETGGYGGPLLQKNHLIVHIQKFYYDGRKTG